MFEARTITFLLALHLPVRILLSQSAAPPLGPSPQHYLPSVYLEDLTWLEIRQAMASGYRTAILYTGSTEANGPHLVLGKHTIIARYVAGGIAKRLGDALVYPSLPFAPAHNPVSRTGLMAFPGTVSLDSNTYRAVVHDVLLSALAVGFQRVFVMGDHGLGQEALRAAAETLEAEWGPKGQHVAYVPDVFYAAGDSMRAYLAAHRLPPDGHAGIDDTSELLFLEGALHASGRWIRRAEIAWADSTQFPIRAIDGDPRRATPQLGRRFLEWKISAGVAAIRRLRGQDTDSLRKPAAPKPRRSSGR